MASPSLATDKARQGAGLLCLSCVSERIIMVTHGRFCCYLGEARLLRRHIAPLLDDGLLDLPGVGPGPGADLLWDVDALLGGLKLGHQLGDVLAGPLGLEGTLLLGGVLDNGLDLVVTLLGALLESTSGGGAELPGLLGAAGDGGVLLHWLLGHAAHLLGPLGAPAQAGVVLGWWRSLYLVEVV